MINIQFIANSITDDPDIFVEDMGMSGNSIDLSSPMSSMELDQDLKSSQDASDPSSALQDQIQQQEELEKKAADERRKLMLPQFQRLGQSMDKIGTGITQSKDQVDNSGTQLGGLEKEMVGVNAILNNLERSI